MLTCQGTPVYASDCPSLGDESSCVAYLACNWDGASCVVRSPLPACGNFSLSECTGYAVEQGISGCYVGSGQTGAVEQTMRNVGNSVSDSFFRVIPIVILPIVAIVITMFGIKWVLSYFGKGRK